MNNLEISLGFSSITRVVEGQRQVLGNLFVCFSSDGSYGYHVLTGTSDTVTGAFSAALLDTSRDKILLLQIMALQPNGGGLNLSFHNDGSMIKDEFQSFCNKIKNITAND